MKIGDYNTKKYKQKLKDSIRSVNTPSEYIAVVVVGMFLILAGTIIVYFIGAMFALIGWAFVSLVSVFMTVPDLTFWAFAGVGFAISIIIKWVSK